MIIDPYEWHTCRITSIERAATDTVAVRLEAPSGYEFKAGQYAVVRVAIRPGESKVRQYSFSSAPGEQTLELLVQHEPGGEVSSWFYGDAKVSDTIEISQPLGRFTLEHAGKRPVLFVAARVGIAPFLSMLQTNPAQDTKLVYSVRSKNQVCLPSFIEKNRAKVVITSQSPRIDANLLRNLIKNDPLVYVCGSKRFVDGMTSELLQLRVPRQDIQRELFTLQ